MPDEFRFFISPAATEQNARRLVGIMAQDFAGRATSGDLCIRFEEVTGLKRQMFYNTLSYAKYRCWLIGGGLDQSRRKFYRLNHDVLKRDGVEYLLDSRTQQIEELQSEVERLRDWTNGDDTNGAGVAIPTLVRIVGDDSASVRQRLRAAAAILGYKLPDDDVAQFTKKFLQSVCESADVAIDYRVEAAELLRRHESPRVAPETVRPVYQQEPQGEPPVPLKLLVAQRRARADAMEREMVRQMALEREMGLRSDGTRDTSSSEDPPATVE